VFDPSNSGYPPLVHYNTILLQETKDEDLERLVQLHCRLDLTSPMPGCAETHRRHLFLEGDLKLKEGLSSKVSVQR
jgi:hypothetical protein